MSAPELAAQAVEYRRFASDAWARGLGRTARMWGRLARRAEREVVELARVVMMNAERKLTENRMEN